MTPLVDWRTPSVSLRGLVTSHLSNFMLTCTLLMTHPIPKGTELGKSINGGYVPNAIGYTLMLTWLTLSIGGLHKVKGMPLVGLGCIATVLLSTAAGFGLCLGFGVKFNPIVPVLPIMLLGE